MHRLIAATLFVAALAIVPINAFAQSESRDDVLNQIKTKRAELSALEEKFLAPSEDDRAAYAEFLRQPDTGLIRLLPREVYDSEVYKKSLKTLTMRGGGAYYSFARLTHEYGYGSDICLDSGYLSVGFAGANYGILTKLSDQRVEEIAVEHPGAHFMAAYNPPDDLPKARLENRRFGGAGATIDNELYKTRMAVEVNTTYLLRSINYDTSDVLVTFRVVRKDSDGSVVIVWKLLKSYSKPVLARDKSEQ